jgi:hypothetical protein
MGRACSTYREKKNTYMVTEDLVLGARIILKWISHINMMGGCRWDSSGSGQGQVVDSCD